MTIVSNFGLWIYNGDFPYIGDSYSTLRKLSRVFVQACDSHGIDKMAFPSPAEFEKHLIDRNAESDILNAFRIAEKEFRTKDKIPVYTNKNFRNWP